MKTMLVDDEKFAMEIFAMETAGISDLEIVGKFENPMDALEFVKKERVDLAVLDIEMPEINGLELGERLRKICPEMQLIYITGYENYAMEALRLHAVSYLLKPFEKEEVLYAIDSARLLSKRCSKRIFAKTFGHFDLFVNGSPIMFHSAKAKELLALLVDRQGGTVTTEQIISVLWEDRPNDEHTQNLCSKICKTLRKELKKYVAEDIFISSRGMHRLNIDLIECDLKQYLEGTDKYRYMGEYMVDYSWGEYRMAVLDRFLR